MLNKGKQMNINQKQILNNKFSIFFLGVALINFFAFNFASNAEFQVTSKDPNYGASQSKDNEFTKTWLCENKGTSTLNVTLTSQKSGRTPQAWGLDNIAENFNLQAGGTQNCGIKLTTVGEKGIGDVSVKISTNEGFERNVNMTYYTDVYKNIFVNASSKQDISKTELFKYISQKYADYSEFNQNDFINLSTLTQNSDFYFYIGGSDTEIDSITAEKLVDAFLSGKSVFICGSEPFYNLSKTHPDHRIWSVFEFRITDDILIESVTKDYMLTVSSPIEMNGVSDFTFDILNETNPIRKIEILMNGNLSLDKHLYVGQSDVNDVGFVKINLLNKNRIIFVNADLHGHKLNEEFPLFTNTFYYSLFFENGTSVRNQNRGAEQNLIIYPNPINNDNNTLNWKTDIQTNEQDNPIIDNDNENYKNLISYEIYDLNGNIITNKTYQSNTQNENSIDIDIDLLQKGIYTIKLVFENQIVTKKLIKD